MPTSPDTTPRIFISHSHKDNEFGVKLVEDLRRVLGDESAVWYDARGGLRPGDRWFQKIEDELTARNIFILLCSSDAMDSEWVRREFDIALNEKKCIIPVLLQRCQLWPYLKTIQHVSFLTPKTYEESFNELLITLGLSPYMGTSKPTQVDNDQKIAIAAQKTKEQWINEGIADFQAKRYEEAIAAYNHAITLDSKDARAYAGRGNAYRMLKKYQQAVQDFNQAIALDPTSDFAYARRGEAYRRLRDYQRAIQDFDRALELNPTDTMSYGRRGQAYSSLGQYHQAIQDFDHALELDPNMTWVKDQREEAYRKLQGRR